MFLVECKPGTGMTMCAVWLARQRHLQGYKVVSNFKGFYTEKEVDLMEELDMVVKKEKKWN